MKEDRKLVPFRFRNVTAKSVEIVGVLGDWHPSFASMEKCSGGVWQKYLRMSPGEHQYRLIIDGELDVSDIRSVTVARPDKDANALSGRVAGIQDLRKEKPNESLRRGLPVSRAINKNQRRLRSDAFRKITL